LSGAGGPLFDKVLIANRGEIAVRVIRALNELGIRSVAVFSEADRAARHVRLADEAYCIGPASSAESYLNAERIVETALACSANAVHPGYGFLSENAAFAAACRDAGLVFIGPAPEAIAAMGDKTEARRRMAEAGIPLIPGTLEPLRNAAHALEAARAAGFPVMLKAAAGGGGKGMRLVHREEDLESALRDASSEAQRAFGNGEVYLEKAVVNPRHVEVQILADSHGAVVYLGERECSLQRRHQKVVEEAPSPAVGPELRRAMGEAAVRAARAVGYVNAGTIEFLLDREGRFYFMEMNTRLQVEHAVTEMVTGLDLVKEQVRIAAGLPLGLDQGQVEVSGWAIECRIYAEDPLNHFLPSPGRVVAVRLPEGPRVRVDASVFGGSEVSLHYDPMVAKVVTWGSDRAEAVDTMRRALQEFQIVGIHTNKDFLERIVAHPEFAAGRLDTGFIPRFFDEEGMEPPGPHFVSDIAAAIFAYESSRRSATPCSERRQPSRWRTAVRPR
jgi:acetyl-CoA carboxylase, biotin carboxylase subunit